jgi:hypothetical protein
MSINEIGMMGLCPESYLPSADLRHEDYSLLNIPARFARSKTGRILVGPLLMTKQTHFFVVRQQDSVFLKPFQIHIKPIERLS